MKTLNVVSQTKRYLDYVEEHIENVRKAWLEIMEKCSDMFFVSDTFLQGNINRDVESHDLSKLSEAEFISYRKHFFGAEGEDICSEDIKIAFKHHIENNSHHWENWANKVDSYPNEWAVNCVGMIIDWTAMGYKFGDTAKDYYERNKDKIKIPDYGIRFIEEIFEKLEEKK